MRTRARSFWARWRRSPRSSSAASSSTTSATRRCSSSPSPSWRSRSSFSAISTLQPLAFGAWTARDRVRELRRGGGGVRSECRSEPSTPPPTRLVLVRGDGLSRRPHADEVVFEPLEVRLGHHVRDEEAGEVALLPHPRREAFLVQERGPEPLDLDTPAVGDRQARCGENRVGHEVVIAVAVVECDAAAPVEVHRLGAYWHQPVIAAEDPRESDA